MEKKTVLLLRRIFGIILSLSIIFAGVCLIAACLSIYYSGDKPYSPQSVSEAFAKISVPVFLCIILTVIGFIIDFILPVTQNKKRAVKINEMNRAALLEKKNLKEAEPEILTYILKERNNRSLHTLIRTLLTVVCGAAFLVYALNPVNFHSSEINASMISAMQVLIPCAIIPFGYSVFTAFLFDRSYAREIELLKKLPKSESTEKKADKDSLKTIVKIAIVVIGLALMIYGLIEGGTADVLTKAMNICTECIGLG